ncbi:hypothetical protein MHU86_12000 [Fragilaria crotonensis]|nr:hypothetical protein MHU86_12000 [Fragilaria crotonensis]
MFINGSPITGNYDDCIHFHVNGYHQRLEIQHMEKWTNNTWHRVDFHTFGNHFCRLSTSRHTQHFKFIHEVLPLGTQRFRESAIKDDAIKRCPCCKTAEETHVHFLRCTSNPVFESSLSLLTSDSILTHDIHPLRYLISAGIHHVLTSDANFSPVTHQYPAHFHSLIESALSSQQDIRWNSAIKGYFSRDWADMVQLEMHANIRDSRKGARHRMKQIISALCAHVRRLWLAQNGCLHNATDAETQSHSTQAIEIQYYHSRPQHLLRQGDQLYCQRPLSKLLSGPPSPRRRWLRKVKQSSAELTKDGTGNQSLITFFSAMLAAGTGYDAVAAYRPYHGDNPIISSRFFALGPRLCVKLYELQ